MKTIVVGGGLLGLSIAHKLQGEGHEVEVLEAREGVGLETSYANGGMLTASMPDPWNAPGVHKHLAASLFDPFSPMKLRLHAIPSLFFWGLKFLRNTSRSRYLAATEANYRLARYSIDKTTELREQLDLHYDASTVGTLKIFHDQKAMEGPLTMARHLEQFGLRFHELDADATIAVEPLLGGIRDRIGGALQFPDDESGDAYRFCTALASHIVDGGGLVRTGVKVTQLLHAGGRISGVKADGKTIPAERVIVATGVNTPALLSGTGISLPIKPAKGYSLTFDVADDVTLPKVPVVDDAMHAAITPFGRRLRAVGTAEFTGLDTRIQQSRIDNLFNLLKTVYPDIATRVDRSTAEPWAGLRPMSSDGKPFIGPCQLDGLYFNAGHGHLGWTMATGSACMLADLIAGRTPAVNPEPFAVHR